MTASTPRLGTYWRPAAGDHQPYRTDNRGDPCRNPSCDRKITRLWAFDGLCSKCSAAQRRWGHVEQVSVQMVELKPYLRAARAARRRNPQADFGVVFAAWNDLVDWCGTGETTNANEREARELVVAIGQAATPDKLLDITAALYVLRELDPARFVNDTCFRLSVAHAVRRAGRAGKVAVKRKPSRVGGRVLLYYKDLPIQTRLHLADLTLTAFGAVAEKIAEIERGRATANAERRIRYAETVAALC